MQAKTIFIADLHFDKSLPKALATFLTYLQGLKKQKVDAIYILGDLFEYWLGDDCLDSNSRKLAKGLSDYHQSTGVPLYFLHGNRDFLLGEKYANLCQFTILPEEETINLYSNNTLILHGDTLCTDDEEYQKFRAKVHSPEWQAKILKLPRWIRKLKAKHLRWISKRANKNKTLEIMDVTPSSVDEAVRKYKVTQIIHGHTHRPNIHDFSVDGTPIKRCVVGDWYEQGSVLEVTPDDIELIVLPFMQ